MALDHAGPEPAGDRPPAVAGVTVGEAGAGDPATPVQVEFVPTVRQLTDASRVFRTSGRARLRLWLIESALLALVVLLAAGPGAGPVLFAAGVTGLLGAVIVLSPWWVPRARRRRWSGTTVRWCLDPSGVTITDSGTGASRPWSAVAEVSCARGLLAIRTGPPRPAVFAMPLDHLTEPELDRIRAWACGEGTVEAAGPASAAGGPDEVVVVSAEPLSPTQAYLLVTRFRSRFVLGLGAATVLVVDAAAVSARQSPASIALFSVVTLGLAAAAHLAVPWLDAGRILRRQPLAGRWTFGPGGVRFDGSSGSWWMPWQEFRLVATAGGMFVLRGKVGRVVTGLPLNTVQPGPGARVLAWAVAGGVVRRDGR